MSVIQNTPPDSSWEVYRMYVRDPMPPLVGWDAQLSGIQVAVGLMTDNGGESLLTL